MSLRCTECGGATKEVNLASYDFSAYAGLKVELRGAIGRRCTDCKAVMLTGEVIEASLHAVALAIAQGKHRLSPPEVKYLRKFLMLTQEELADRMGAHRKTVNEWETAKLPISESYDMTLRGLVVHQIMRDCGEPPCSVDNDDLMKALGGSVRKTAAPKKPRPYVIEGALKKMRAIRTTASGDARTTPRTTRGGTSDGS